MSRSLLFSLLLVTQVACMQRDIAPDQAQPARVSLGMTIRQVEALMGRSPYSCSNYLKGKYEADRICFVGGKARSGTVGEESSKWRQPRFLSATRSGASETEVERAWGPPDTVERGYSYRKGDEQGDYFAVYKQGQLNEFTLLPPLAVPQPPHCPNPMVFFDLGSSDFPARSRKWLSVFTTGSGVCDMGKVDKSTACLYVTGHADQSGSDAGNQQLSQRRADAVARFVVALGFPRERIVVTAKGSSQPMVLKPTKPDGSEPQNRRVEVWYQHGDSSAPCKKR